MLKIISTFIIIVGVFCAKPLQAQLTLDPPILERASVVAGTGNVEISWQLQDSSDVFIYRNKIPSTSSSPEWELITTIKDTSIKTYIDITAHADTMSRIYKVRAESDGYDSEKFPTTYLTAVFDSCKSEVSLSWSIYVNDIYNEGDITVHQYEVYQEINGDPPLLLATLSADQQNYTVENVNPNSNYSYFVNLIPQHAQSSRSSSNRNDVFTEMSLNPSFINGVYASVNGASVDLKFDIDPNSELSTYKLLRSTDPSGNFDTLETITTNESFYTTVDSDVNPDNTTYYYQLVAVNNCGIETTQSDVINTILLEIDKLNYDISLNWNHFKSGTLVNYKIFRVINEQDPVLIGDRSFNYYDDNIESFQNYTQFCYYIQALKAGTSEDDYSQSNTVCIYLNPKVYIAEAFTPNGDGLNDEFKPIFSFIPTHYEFKVFNRWGNILFETGDYSKPWKGKEMNGNSAPAGAYIYYVKIQTPNEQIFEQKGSVMVIYP